MYPMSGNTEEHGRQKPDGSAYRTHLAELDKRNAATRSEGQAKRAAREQEETVSRREAERRQNRGLISRRQAKGELR
jgi:hypothetical protein